MAKKSIYVSEADEIVFEKAKELFGDSLAKVIANTLREKVERQEALNAGMIEQTVYDGKMNTNDRIFQGKTAKFYGRLLVEGQHEGFDRVHMKVYLTKKGKFLVAEYVRGEHDTDEECSYNIYDDYYDMKEKAQLSHGFIKACEEYLNKNSTIRTYEMLDI
jgi:hypothetical protein